MGVNGGLGEERLGPIVRAFASGATVNYQQLGISNGLLATTNAEMSKTMISKRISLTLLASLVMICAAVLLTHNSAKAQSEEPANERFTGYQTPTGPELEPLAAASSAANTYARQAGQDGELEVKTAHGTFAQAQAVLEEKAPSQAAVGGTPEIAEWRASPAYLVVIEATAPNATFTPNVPTPPGRTGPSGKVMGLILESHTGFVEGRYVGPNAPKLSELGPVASTTLPAVTSTAEAASLRAKGIPSKLGELAGKVYGAGHRLVKGWRVLIGHPHTALGQHAIAARRTDHGGGFSFQFPAGQYLVAAQRPNGKLCGVRTARIVQRAETHIVLTCAT